MGEPTEGEGRLGQTAVLDDPGTDVVDGAAPEETDPRSEFDIGRRRYTIASVVGMALTAVPFVWILWGPWESPDPLRQTVYEDNYYDLQARAMFHGHLYLANGAIGIEGFVHGGHTYTYFGLFPSIIRMPILAVTHSLDARLTAPYMLLAWLLSALFASLLVWRVRILVRGQAPMGWAEATSFGLLTATITGGTIFMLLAATPFVFNEDIAWSVCLTLGSIFALLGVIERPSWGRVITSFVLVLAANLDRSTTGWACVAAAALIAVWLGLGRGGAENRRWFLPVLGVGVVPLVIGCAVNYSKFGVLFGVSNFEQVWTHVNVYRRKFLAANHNAEEGIIFVPSNLLAYFRPDGLRLTSYFPFISLPAAPAPALFGVLFDRRYRTASVPSSMPLLFLLSCWGLVTAFRPRPVAKVALTRILLLASGGAGAALLLWGYIAPRYLGDFVPFLALASVVAMADIWRRLDGARRSRRIGATVIIAAVALFTIWANIGMGLSPNEESNPVQALHYVQAQKTVSDLLGNSLSTRVRRGNSLPPWGPADQLYVIGDCNGLYVSTGEQYDTVPSEWYTRATWIAVERGQYFEHAFRITLTSAPTTTTTVPLVTAGTTTVSYLAVPEPRTHQIVIVPGIQTAGGRLATGHPQIVAVGNSYQLDVVTDPVKHLIQVSLDGGVVQTYTPNTAEPIRVDSPSSPGTGAAPVLSVVNDTSSLPKPTLCESLIH